MSINCLILEDQPITQEIIEEYSKMLGLNVTSTSSAEAAIRSCTSIMPDCIILDWHMPGIDGLDFLKILREMPNGNKPKVIMCTCDDLIGQKHDIKKLGVKTAIAKPIKFDNLKKALVKEGII